MNIPFVNNEPGGAEKERKQFDALLSDDAARLSRYFEYEVDYKRARRGETKTRFDYGRRSKNTRPEKQRHSIPLPYAHAIVQKHTYRIAGNLPDIVCPRLGNSTAERFRSDTKEKILYAAWQHSQAQLQFASGAHHGSLFGSSCYDVYWDVAAGMPRFREISPRGVLVVPGLEQQHDFEAVFRFWRVSRQTFEARYPGISVPDDREAQDKITIVQKTDRHKTVRFAGRTALPMNEQGDLSVPNTHGFVPYVVIPNLGPIEELWGLSDYEFFKDIANYIEALNSRMADVAEAVGNGAMQDHGSGQDPDAVIEALRSGGLIPVRKDGKGIEPVNPPQFGNWVDGHWDFVRGALNDLGFTPPAAWGDIGAASGSDRALQIAPQVELTALKQIHFGAGLQRLNAMLLQMIEAKFDASTPLRGVHQRGFRRTPFAIVLKDAAEEQLPVGDSDPGASDTDLEPIPTNPKDLIDGDYCTEIEWKRQLDRDDANFVLSELNKFQQGAQSLYTTLEKFGSPDPEDEMRLIEEEAKRMPWLRSGMVALLTKQIQASQTAGDGGGGVAPGGDLTAAMQTIGGGGGGVSGALTQDALAGSLNGSSNSGGRGPGSVPGAQYGGA